ncbi:MAG: class I SAM-dependent methyltransferase, partial [Gammaproteobacteria bacterium]|nr:class I SAM-dependent methyltransferase [Gammaproteobacteria bacterium]
FDSVADRYDVMNDLMSLGLHRLWKQFTLTKTGLRDGDRVLDIAAGSGDLSIGLAKQVGQTGLVLATDINARMLCRGRDRILDAGYAATVRLAVADAEQLPFRSRQFNCVTISFGLRNVTDKAA